MPFARLPHAILVPAALATTIFVTALGSSSVAVLADMGRPVRWLALLALLLAAGAWAAARSEPVRLPSGAAAAAVLFVAFTAASALWSVKPMLTEKRAVSLALVVAAAACAAYAVAGRPALAERLIYGMLAGAAAVALAGLPLLVVDHAAAVRPASYGVPARYQGIGESPNTVALLLALAVPMATWVALGRRRTLGIALLLLFGGSLAASASRGGLVAALAGSLVVIALSSTTRRRALVLGAVACAVFAGAVALGELSQPGTLPPARAGAGAATAVSKGRYADAQAAFPLDDDIGRPLPGEGDNEGTRTLLGSSGRTAAWNYALGQTLMRPVAGYGFGTEQDVFTDRFANFDGGFVENSYIGLMLQVGTAGLASFVLVVAAAVAAGRARLAAGGFGSAVAGAVAAGLVVALVQSYVYSAGNIATLTFWLATALTAVAAVGARET